MIRKQTQRKRRRRENNCVISWSAAIELEEMSTEQPEVTSRTAEWRHAVFHQASGVGTATIRTTEPEFTSCKLSARCGSEFKKLLCGIINANWHLRRRSISE